MVLCGAQYPSEPENCLERVQRQERGEGGVVAMEREEGKGGGGILEIFPSDKSS